MEWREYARCKGKLVDIWYPPLDAENQEQYHAVAREVCNICPVWKECLIDGIGENWGMWGGLTTLERRDLIQIYKIPKGTEYVDTGMGQ